MSFRLSIPRITILIATALGLLDERERLAALPVTAAVPAPENSPLRKLERAAAKARAHFSDGHRKGIIAIISELLDVTDEERKKVLEQTGEAPAVVPWKVGDIIIPLLRDNGHDYPLGQPIISYQGDVCLQLVDGELHARNHMTITKDAWRFATREEIVAFGQTLHDAYNKGVLGDENDTLLVKMGLIKKA